MQRYSAKTWTYMLRKTCLPRPAYQFGCTSAPLELSIRQELGEWEVILRQKHWQRISCEAHSVSTKGKPKEDLEKSNTNQCTSMAGKCERAPHWDAELQTSNGCRERKNQPSPGTSPWTGYPIHMDCPKHIHGTLKGSAGCIYKVCVYKIIKE